MKRLYDFMCRVCGDAFTVPSAGDPGKKPCRGCKQYRLVYWRSRPSAPFTKPDTVAMGLGPAPRFGPSDAELAETGIPNTRIRADLDSMQMKDEPPVFNREAKKQLRLL